MKITIITVSYNSERTIRDTINSVLNQTYSNIEYIIIDGKSRDNTIRIIGQYEEVFKKNKKDFSYISEIDNGIYDAMNKGIKMSKGDIIGFLNSDDYFYDTEVIEDIAYHFECKDIDCLYGNTIFIDRNSKKVVRKRKSRQFKKGLFEKSWTPGHPTFYCKKIYYDKYGLYRTDYKIVSDVELMYRFIEKNFIKSFYYDRFITIMRTGGVSTNGIISTLIITKEMSIVFGESIGRFNLLKYLFFKLLKMKEFIIKTKL